MASSEKRCLYEVLGVHRECTADEIRSAYKKLALQRHPDKLVQSGLSQAEATASFQELVNAYEVLSDPRERAWYDSHRSQILFSGSDRSNSSGSIPDLFSFFSKSVFSGYSDAGKGFYKVYSDVFDKIYSNELNFAKKLGLGLDAVKEAPVMGNLESPYTQVTAFYNYWLGFVTVMDFCWVDQYDAMAGPNRKSRRVMEEENKKMRKKARREYNETVRSLAEFVKKRDKRVIDMQVRRHEEMERKREEERRKKKELEREKMERARAYEEPDWAKVDGEIEEEDYNEIEDEKKSRDDGTELFCVVCRKKFKSDKQWKNHEQSKKHKEKVAELREALSEEENENDEGEDDGEEENVGIDDLSNKFAGSFQFQEQDNSDEKAQSTEEEVDGDEKDGGGRAVNESFESDDDEASILEAMVSGHKSRKNASVPKAKASSTKTHSRNDSDDMDFMVHNNRKSSRRKKGARGDRGRRYDEEAGASADAVEVSSPVQENDEPDDSLRSDETSAHDFAKEKSNGVGDGRLEMHEVSKKPPNAKSVAKKDSSAKLKKSSKGKKQKATSRNSGSVCETCGVDFESRNKLYIHLGATGHSTLKSR